MSNDYETQQALDEAPASARADVEESEANYASAKTGPTKEQRAIAAAGVEAATSALAVLERRLDKTFLRSSADGVVTEIVAEVGEAIGEAQGESEMIPGIVTELLPLGPFATWQAERLLALTISTRFAYASICWIMGPSLSPA